MQLNRRTETERKLELTRLIREENRDNRMRMRSRERILYGKGTAYQDYGDYKDFGGYRAGDPYDYPLSAAEYGPMEGREGMSSFGLRFLIAAILFSLYYFMRVQGLTLGGVSANTIETAVVAAESQTDTDILEFVKEIPAWFESKE